MERISHFKADRMAKKNKKKTKVKLLPHETALLQSGQLVDVTHAGSTATWLWAESSTLNNNNNNEDSNRTLVYRHMGDPECAFLLQTGQLPSTQPYQTIVQDQVGRAYCEGYLRGLRKPSGNVVTTVVEFEAPKDLIGSIFEQQCKIEDGCMSHGLGNKGGNGLPQFNQCLASGDISFRIVLVKRKND